MYLFSVHLENYTCMNITKLQTLLGCPALYTFIQSSNDMKLFYLMYYETRKSASLRYFDKYFMQNIRVSDRRRRDSLSMQYIYKESCHRLSEPPPILYTKYVSK